MKLYVVYCHDRHCDPEVRVFSEHAKAVKFAWSYMRSSVAHPELLYDDPVEGYSLNLRYAEESDCAFVQAVTLDDESE